MQRHRPGNHPAARLDQPGTVRFRVPHSAPGISVYSTASPARPGRSVRSATISLASQCTVRRSTRPGRQRVALRWPETYRRTSVPDRPSSRDGDAAGPARQAGRSGQGLASLWRIWRRELVVGADTASSGAS
jgi:hypothetical protein